MITTKMTGLRFDSPRVIRATDAATRQALSRAGAFIRRRAKTSIRKRKAISRRGAPPSSHAGHLRRLIYFGYDPAAQNVVIGPLKFRKGEAPNLLEFSGRVTRPDDAGRPRKLVYRKRPFMGPAMQAELPQLPKRWRNSVRGG